MYYSNIYRSQYEILYSDSSKTVNPSQIEGDVNIPYSRFNYRIISDEYLMIQFEGRTIAVTREAPYRFLCIVSVNLRYFRYLPLQTKLRLTKHDFEPPTNEDVQDFINTFKITDYEKYILDVSDVFRYRFPYLYYRDIYNRASKFIYSMTEEIFETLYLKFLHIDTSHIGKRRLKLPEWHTKPFKITNGVILGEIGRMKRKDFILLRYC